jgi:hypothetical protein
MVGVSIGCGRACLLGGGTRCAFVRHGQVAFRAPHERLERGVPCLSCINSEISSIDAGPLAGVDLSLPGIHCGRLRGPALNSLST